MILSAVTTRIQYWYAVCLISQETNYPETSNSYQQPVDGYTMDEVRDSDTPTPSGMQALCAARLSSQQCMEIADIAGQVLGHLV